MHDDVISLFCYVILIFRVSPLAVIQSEGGIVIQDLSIICGLSNAEECCELKNSLVCTLGDDSSDDVIPLNPPPVTSSSTKNFNFNKSGHFNRNSHSRRLNRIVSSSSSLIGSKSDQSGAAGQSAGSAGTDQSNSFLYSYSISRSYPLITTFKKVCSSC